MTDDTRDMSDISEKKTRVELYRDAVQRLQLAAQESSKSGDVDLARLMASHHSACRLVQRLISFEQQPVRLCGLKQLAESLAGQQVVLQEKHRQLQGDSEHSLTPQPSSLVGRGVPCDMLDRRRHSAIEEMIITPDNLQLSSCVGHEEAKQLLREAVLLPLSFPHLFSDGRQPWQRILLYGPPGTGKTRLAHAIASESRALFYNVSSADILSSWVGESEKLIRDLFYHARQQTGQPVIVFIDEVDSVCRQRSVREEDHTRRVKTELLHQMDANRINNVFLLCATNCPWELDTAFLRRFQRKVFVGLPCSAERCELLRLHLGSTFTSISDNDLQLLSERTEGYTGSDIAHLASEALLRPIRELETAQYWVPIGRDLQPCSPDHPGAMRTHLKDISSRQVRSRNVTANDVLAAMQTFSPSVTQEYLKQYH